jgi:hypothetical protein
MAPIPLSCTGWLAAFFTCLIKCFSSEKKKKTKKNDAFAGYQFRGLGKFLAWLEQTALASPLLSKF